MARRPRLTLAHHAHHVIQRGNNCQAIFSDAADRQVLLDLLAQHAQAQRVAIHAYVLMSNHIHLLATPETAEGLPLVMQGVGRAYVRQFNRRHGRSGTLFEGRYRSAVIEAERHLLACMAYIELNPVRAGLAADAADYPWSSHAHHVGLRADALVTAHPLYWQLGNTPFAREQAYGELVRAGLPQPEREAMGRAAHGGWALGGDAFIADLERRTARRLTMAAPGRPARPGRAAPADTPRNALADQRIAGAGSAPEQGAPADAPHGVSIGEGGATAFSGAPEGGAG